MLLTPSDTLTLNPDEPLSTLIVDDDETYADETARKLLDDGYKVTVVHTAEEALSGAQRTEPLDEARVCDVHDFVYLDLDLPGMIDGIDLLKEIRARQPDKWIIPNSGVADEKSRFRREFPDETLFEKLPGKEETEEIRRRCEGWQEQKRQFGSILSTIHQELLGARSAKDDLVAHRHFLAAKRPIRENLWDQVRKRNPLRRDLATILRMCINTLSFVPSQEFGLTKPTPDQIDALIEVVEYLGLPHVTEQHRQQLIDRLEAVGLQVGTELANAEELDWHS